MNSEEFIKALESGVLRAASPNTGGEWVVHQEVKEGILNLFRVGELKECSGTYQGFVDKHNLPPRAFHVDEKIRMVPGGSSVRTGAYVAKGVVIMPPSYINIGAYVDEGAMVDSHVLVGSCAQIGKNVHLSAAVQIGGVLEPIGAKPVIVEDGAFIGAGVVIVEGIHVKKNVVIAPGVVLSKNIPVYDCVNECMITDQTIPEDSVVVPGARPASNPYAKALGLSMQCPIIIKKRDHGTSSAVTLESAVRESA